MKVFVCVIKYFKDCVLEDLERLCLGLYLGEDKFWVIIFLVFWDDKVKKFM